jgi:hypothetical protein
VRNGFGIACPHREEPGVSNYEHVLPTLSFETAPKKRLLGMRLTTLREKA